MVIYVVGNHWQNDNNNNNLIIGELSLYNDVI